MTPAEMRGNAVGADLGWRAACPWLLAALRPGSVYVGPTGEILRVDEAGYLGVVHQGGMPGDRSIAADPSARRRS